MTRFFPYLCSILTRINDCCVPNTLITQQYIIRTIESYTTAGWKTSIYNMKVPQHFKSNFPPCWFATERHKCLPLSHRQESSMCGK